MIIRRNNPPKRPIWDPNFNRRPSHSDSTSDLPSAPSEAALTVWRRDIPPIDGDKDILFNEGGGLGTQANAWE